MVAEGVRAEDEATALGQKLESEALSSKAGRTYSAILAVEAFELGTITLNSMDPEFIWRIWPSSSSFGSSRARL